MNTFRRQPFDNPRNLWYNIIWNFMRSGNMEFYVVRITNFIADLAMKRVADFG